MNDGPSLSEDEIWLRALKAPNKSRVCYCGAHVERFDPGASAEGEEPTERLADLHAHLNRAFASYWSHGSIDRMANEMLSGPHRLRRTTSATMFHLALGRLARANDRHVAALARRESALAEGRVPDPADNGTMAELYKRGDELAALFSDSSRAGSPAATSVTMAVETPQPAPQPKISNLAICDRYYRAACELDRWAEQSDYWYDLPDWRVHQRALRCRVRRWLGERPNECIEPDLHHAHWFLSQALNHLVGPEIDDL